MTAELPDPIRDDCEVLSEKSRPRERKESLRGKILAGLARMNVADVRNAHGRAERKSRFRLLPKRDKVLGLLAIDDLHAFAHLTPSRVKEVLVPKCGRERLLPLFDVQKSETLWIRRPEGEPGGHDEPDE